MWNKLVFKIETHSETRANKTHNFTILLDELPHNDLIVVNNGE